MEHDAFSVLRAGAPQLSLVITCEHASARLPPGWQWHAEDLPFVDDHWAYDRGARELTQELASIAGAPAVLSRFTRLLADPNRAEDSPDLFRTKADGKPVWLNQSVTETERDKRLAGYYRPYHDALDRTVGASSAALLLSMHTFTPVYEGEVRTVEVGILFDAEEALAARLGAALASTGLVVLPNEPYSGKAGLMHSVERHATAHGRRAIEIEVRQDLAVSPAFRAKFVPALARALAEADAQLIASR